MSKFRIIPVIDLLNSIAVHAIKGKRNEYQPLKTILINTSDPLKIIQFLKKDLGFNEFYIADLDSIMKRNPNLEILTEILKISFIKVMLDPGIIDANDIRTYSKLKLNKIIIGLETINKIENIIDCVELVGSENIILSIDMFEGKIISRIEKWKHKKPTKIIPDLDRIGVNELILLDLFRVGQKIGGIPQSYIEMQKSFDGNVLVGGGIRDIDDIISLKNENFAGVLIATALYDKSIKIEDLWVL